MRDECRSQFLTILLVPEFANQRQFEAVNPESLGTWDDSIKRLAFQKTYNSSQFGIVTLITKETRIFKHDSI